MLAESLQKKPVYPRIKWTPPEIQTADRLLKLRFDIPKIDALLGLGATDLCCVTGISANLILTRLCFRSLLPERYGGMNSPYAMVADCGNRSDVYRTINFARQYGLNKEKTADRILVIRAFTVPQVSHLLSVELPKIIKKYRLRCVIIPGLLNTIDEETTMRAKDARREIGKMMKVLAELSKEILVITSIQDGKYKDWVMPEFKKHVSLSNARQGWITTEIFNQGRRNTISLTERELKIIPKR
jgi:hypothetical protein